MTTSVHEASVRRVLAVLGVLALTWTFVHAGFAVVALTSGTTVGTTREALKVMGATSPFLAALAFCAAALAFSGRAPERRPQLAGASLLLLLAVCAVLLEACAVLVLRDAALWAPLWVALNTPLVVALAVCRRVFRAAQRERLGLGT
jgi:hypothetical protein